MAVAQRHDGVGQHGFSQYPPRMAPPSSYPDLGYDRQTKGEDHAEPMWPVHRVQQHLQQGAVNDRSRDLAGLSNTFSQSDFARHQASHGHYTYDGSSSELRNPIVYSQPAQAPWSMAAQSTAEYPEYPTASFMAPMQRAQLPVHNQAAYLGSTNGAYSVSSLSGSGDTFPKVMNGSTTSAGASYDHTTETLWPLGPNSLDAFAGLTAPSGQATRLTLTSAADRNKLKSRSSLPPPKQFKCSACDAIFSRNHDLKRHARIHLAVKPFPCGYCDKAFSRKDALKRHVLVKGCGIGNKKQNDSRKRAATLSKLEHSEGNSTTRAPYDSGPSETRMRDFSTFRDDLHYQGQQHQHQGLEGDPGNSRSFPGRSNPSWPSAATEVKTEFGSSRMGSNDERAHLPQLGTLPSYGTQQSQQYSSFAMGEEAFQQPQRQQLPGGLVNAFTSPEGTSASSPADSQPKHAMSGNMFAPGEALGVKEEAKQTSRPGSAKLLDTMPYGAQSFSVENNGLNAVGIANEAGNGFGNFSIQAKDRFGTGGFQSTQTMSPSLGGGSDQNLGNPHAMSGLKREQHFGTYFGNNAAS